jgi:hypothetical protein
MIGFIDEALDFGFALVSSKIKKDATNPVPDTNDPRIHGKAYGYRSNNEPGGKTEGYLSDTWLRSPPAAGPTINPIALAVPRMENAKAWLVG